MPNWDVQDVQVTVATWHRQLTFPQVSQILPVAAEMPDSKTRGRVRVVRSSADSENRWSVSRVQGPL